MGLKLSLNNEGAQALREFADVLPQTMNNIKEDTEELMQYFESVEDQLGVHAEDFRDILSMVNDALKKGEEAITELAPRMKATADKIDDYVGRKPTL